MSDNERQARFNALIERRTNATSKVPRKAVYIKRALLRSGPKERPLQFLS